MSHVIKRTNVTQEIAQYIIKNIESGHWAEGDRIESETQMCKKLGVSRASVRVAIRQFIAYGMLESVQGKGTFVRKANVVPGMFSTEDCADIEKVMQFRATIEGDAAFYAAQYATKEDILCLRENFRQMSQADTCGDRELSWEFDKQFHKKVAEISQNQFYLESIDMMFRSTDKLHFKIIENLGVRFANYFHPAVISALESHDCEKARLQMQRHLQDFVEMIKMNP